MLNSFTLPKRILILVVLIAFLLGSGGAARIAAQASNAGVTGTVMDPSGGAIAGATVTAKNVETGISQSTVSDELGRYRIPNLQVGNYEVQASKTGFQTLVRKGITLTVGTESVADLSLKVGESKETVVVESDVSSVETTSATVSSLISQTQMSELPLNGRNYTQLVEMAPGVQTVPPTAAGGGGSRTFYGGQTNYAVSGSRPVGQAYLLDYTNIQGYFDHGPGSAATGSALGVEAIAEFQVLTNTYSAQFGGSGAVINAVSKSGGNTLHGSLYEYLRNSALDAKNFFDQADANIPAFRRNQFGGTIGGPIKKDKFFFFANYEGLREAQGETHLAYVPDDYVHNGYIPCAAGSFIGTNDPSFCNASFPLIPLGFASPQIQAIIDLYPMPTASMVRQMDPVMGPTGWVEYPNAASDVRNENYFLVRTDYTLSSKDSFFLRYVSDRGDQLLPFPASNLPYWPEKDNTANQYFVAEEKHQLSSSIFNMARVSFVRTRESALTTTDTPPLNFPGTGSLQNGSVAVGCCSPIGASGTVPFTLIQNKYGFGDDVYMSRGAHNIKFGVEIDRVQTNMAAPFNAGGNYIFTGLDGLMIGIPVVFLGMYQSPDFSTSRYFREVDFFPYFQDDWKVTPKLTVNLGLRWDFATNAAGAGAQPLMAILDPLASTGFTQVNHVLANNPNKKNFDPRIGLAYDPFSDHKTSIRAGFGMFHQAISPRNYSAAYYLAPPSQAVLLTPAPGIDKCVFGIFPCFPLAYPDGAPPYVAFAGMDYATNRSPYVMQYNLTLQREMLHNLVVSVGYVGSSGVHLLTQVNQNPGVPGTCAPGDPVTYGCAIPGVPGAVGFGTVNTNFLSLNNDMPISHSNYNSMQVSVNRRTSKGLQVQMSYTYSKSMDNGSTSYSLEQGAWEMMNPYNPSADRGPSAFDRKHAFRMNTVYELPFHGNKLKEGWQVSQVLSAYSGFPFSPQFAIGYDPVGIGGIEGFRPNYSTGVAGCNPDHILGDPAQWYDPNCYVQQPIGTFGNVGRNTLRGPGLLDLDVSLSKETKIRERVNLQFRAEFFNIINHPNWAGSSFDYAILSGGAINPAAGRLTSTSTSSRQIQFGLKLKF